MTTPLRAAIGRARDARAHADAERRHNPDPAAVARAEEAARDAADYLAELDELLKASAHRATSGR